MLSEINTLREITRCYRDGVPLSDDHAEWLRAGLDRFLRHECLSIDDALGLRAGQGGVPWWMEEAMRERDRALRDLAGRFFAGLTVTAKARALYAAAARYAASAWRFDRERGEMPAQYRGTVKEYLWRAFRSGAAMPVCERHLRSIIGP